MNIQSQTFYLDPNRVAASSIAFLTSVNLYFEKKPDANINVSGITNPTVSISISDTTSTGSPIYSRKYQSSNVTKAYSAVSVSNTAATPTTFTFSQPLQLDTGKTYSINVSADDPGYVLWRAQTGNVILGTSNSPFAGFSGGDQGQLYDYGNDGVLTPITNTQLKYDIKIAQFSSNTTTVEVVNDNLEFLVTTKQNLNFLGGELVFPVFSNVSAQTVSFTAGSNVVTGTSTTFSSQFSTGQSIIAYYSNTGSRYVGNILTVSNNTSMTLDEAVHFTNTSCDFFKAPVGKVYYNDASANVLILTKSNANGSSYRFSNSISFTGQLNTNTTVTAVSNTYSLFVGQPVTASIVGIPVGTTIANVVNTSVITLSAAATASGSATISAKTLVAGELTGATAYISVINYPLNSFTPEFGVNYPDGSNTSMSYSFASSNGSAFIVSNSSFSSAINYKHNELSSGSSSQIVSRSNETSQVSQGVLYDGKSAVLKIVLSQANTANVFYSSPLINTEKLDLFPRIYNINNSDTDEVITGQGNAAAKHISTVITFDPKYSAQDLLVQSVAYIPAQTQILAYAKLYNSTDSDSFDVKEWTKLASVSDTNDTPQVSTPEANNYIQLSFGLPNAPLSTSLTGQVTASANGTVTGANTLFTSQLVVGDVVKIYNPNVPANYQISRVNTITSNTVIVLNEGVSNASIAQAGFLIDKITNPNQAFTNPQNYNVVRYYNKTGQAIDNFDAMQIKMVMLSSDPNVVPRIASLSAVGLSS